MKARRPRRVRQPGRRASMRVQGIADDLGGVLDEINAWGLLSVWQEAQHRDITPYGPDAFRGFIPRAWVGVALWYKQKGYYFYDRLRLLGIWALRSEADGTEIVCGLRVLRYSLPFFSAESYYHRIRREFRTCYKDNGRPPETAALLFSDEWDPARRLEIRHALEETLQQWALHPD